MPGVSACLSDKSARGTLLIQNCIPDLSPVTVHSQQSSERWKCSYHHCIHSPLRFQAVAALHWYPSSGSTPYPHSARMYIMVSLNTLGLEDSIFKFPNFPMKQLKPYRSTCDQLTPVHDKYSSTIRRPPDRLKYFYCVLYFKGHVTSCLVILLLQRLSTCPMTVATYHHLRQRAQLELGLRERKTEARKIPCLKEHK